MGTANTTALRFRRIEAGRYQADTDTHRYLIVRTRKSWALRVWRLLETAGVKHTIGLGLDDVEDDTYTDTKTLAVAVANRYKDLVAEGYGAKFTDMRPMTRAVIDAYKVTS